MKKTLKKWICAALIPAMLLGVLAGCKSRSDTTTSGSTDKATVINVADQTAFFLFKVAEAKGMFEEEFGDDNITVKMVSYVKQGPAIVESMASKDIDIAMLGTMPLVSANANGNEIVALASGNYTADGFSLFAGASTGITDVSELKGKKIGLPFGTNEYEVAIEILAAHDLTTDDVELTNLSASDSLTALKKGDIDAALLKGDNYYQAKEAGAVEIANNSETGVVTNDIVGRKAFVEANPTLTARFLKVCAKAAAYVEANEDEAIAIAVEKTGTTTDAAKINYESRTRLVSVEDKYFSTPLKKTISFCKAQGLTDTEVSLDDILNTSYYKKAGI